MKPLSIVIAMLFSLLIYAQVPQGIKYQAVARDQNSEILSNENISVRISIVDSASGGTAVYEETHKTNTNQFGLFSVELGRGINSTGSFQNIAWATGNKWIIVALDPTGGNNHIEIARSEMLSVPYALYAASAPNTGGDDNQILSLNGSTLSIENGNSVNLADLDTTNELNTSFSFNVATNVLTLTDAGAALSVNLSSLDTVGGSGSSSWGTTGNVGTDPANNFIGTIDDVPLNFRIHNEKAGTIENISGNTFIGHRAGSANTTGTGNTAFGKQAFFTNTEGYNNTAVGYFSLTNNTFGHNNSAIGVSSLYHNTTGGENIAVGYQALFDNLGGNNNTACGTFALVHNTSAFNNSAVGHEAMRDNNTGNNNTAVGTSALAYNISADYNSALGVEALFYNTTGYNNTAGGGGAMYSNTSGYNNTALGYSALDSNFTGTNNTAIGFHANVIADSLNNATAIGANAVVSSSNSLVLGNNANVGIGISSPARSLHVKDVIRLEPRATSPANAAEGDIYMDSATHKLMVYDGTTWHACW